MSYSKRVLVVEDDANDLELTLEALEEAQLGTDVQVAADGIEALDYLLRRGRHSHRRQINPILVLLDLKIPKVCGLDVLKEIRAAPETRDVPVVIFSSSAQDQDVREGYSLGANAYIVKPADLGEFLSVIRDIGHFWAKLNQPPPISSN